MDFQWPKDAPRYHRTLPEIIQRQGRKNQPQPRTLDGTTSEVTEICVERFNTRHGKKHATEYKKADRAVSE